MSQFLGHPQDRDLRVLKQLERSIEAQLEIEHQLTEQDKREIDLAACFPAGRLVLRGAIAGIHRTLDPELISCYVIQDGMRKGMLYINTLRKKCTALDCLIGGPTSHF